VGNCSDPPASAMREKLTILNARDTVECLYIMYYIIVDKDTECITLACRHLPWTIFWKAMRLLW